MYKKTLKRNKGITLIALVVTIIVLLILVGIVIMMLTGQNGILNRASEARDMTGTAQEEEQVKLLAMEVTTQTLNIHDNLTQDILDKAIKNQFGKDGGEGEIISDGYNVTVKKTGNVYQIKDGVVEKVPSKEDLKVDEHPGELEKVGEHAWQINSIEDLVALSYEVGSGQNSYEGETVELGRDLWFTGEFNSYRNENAVYIEEYYGYIPEDENRKGNTTIKQYMIERNGFIGIGIYNNVYKGSFDGKGHALYNAKFSTRDGSYGVFGNINAVQDIEFKDFTLKQGIAEVQVASNYGIIASLTGSKNVIVSNIKNNFGKSINAEHGGGIIGSVEGNVNLNINNCYNTTTLNEGTASGGIVGLVEGESIDLTITGCNNFNDKEEYNVKTFGGAIGKIEKANSVNIINFRNNANIILKKRGYSYYGGVAGEIKEVNRLKMEDILIDGNLKNDDKVSLYAAGGIGNVSGESNIDINKFTNNFDIEYASMTGGIVAYCYNKPIIISISESTNNAELTGTADCGGIAGYIINGEVSIKNCENNGIIDGDRLGGILGETSCNKINLENCQNRGKIGKTEGGINSTIVGGMIGSIETGDKNTKKINIKGCKNETDLLNGKWNAGGMVGYGQSNNQNDVIILEDCINTANIYGGTKVGGIVGAGKTIANGCYNTGDVISESSNQPIVSGIAGSEGSKITNSYNTGKIESKSLAAGISCFGTVENSYNTGEIIGGANSGGINSTMGGSEFKASKCFNSGRIKSGCAGGISGYGGTVTDCYNTGEIEGTSIVGGITSTGTVAYCYNTGYIKNNNSNPVGGIVGNGTATDSHNTGDVTGPENGAYVRGEIVGMGTIKGNCYYLIKDSNAKTDSCIGKNKSEMDEIMSLKKFIDNLNTKIEQENSNPENTTKLKSWKLENGKPVFAE